MEHSGLPQLSWSAASSAKSSVPPMAFSPLIDKKMFSQPEAKICSQVPPLGDRRVSCGAPEYPDDDRSIRDGDRKTLPQSMVQLNDQASALFGVSKFKIPRNMTDEERDSLVNKMINWVKKKERGNSNLNCFFFLQNLTPSGVRLVIEAVGTPKLQKEALSLLSRLIMDELGHSCVVATLKPKDVGHIAESGLKNPEITSDMLQFLSQIACESAKGAKLVHKGLAKNILHQIADILNRRITLELEELRCDVLALFHVLASKAKESRADIFAALGPDRIRYMMRPSVIRNSLDDMEINLIAEFIKDPELRYDVFSILDIHGIKPSERAMFLRHKLVFFESGEE